MKLWSWNVNGLRACANKGFLEWLDGSNADIVALQEVRALPEQLPAHVREPEGWWTHFFPAQRKGYSGVALYARRPADEVITTLGESRFDDEGRLQLARWDELWVANGYFPNGSGSKERDNSRVPYKLDFYRRLFDVLEPMRAAGAPVLVVGDFNTAHRDIDLARPKDNRKTSGFLPEECAELDRWVEGGWTDTFRHLNPDTEGAYSWWSNRLGARERNVGWRIDYVMASDGAVAQLQDAHIAHDVLGSDHCPVGVELDLG